MVPELKPAPGKRVALAIAHPRTADDARRTLSARGLACETLADDDADSDVVVALAPAAALTPAVAERLAPRCELAARAGHPVVILCPPHDARGRALDRTDEGAAARAFLRSAGAILCDDPDVWIETLVLLSCHGLPAGPRVAVVAPEGSLLFCAASALEREAMGARVPPVARDAGALGPTDVALVDRATVPDGDRVANALLVPVVQRGELVAGDGRAPLVGLRAALAAATAAGELAQRLAAGLGPASADDARLLKPERDRFRRQLDKLDDRAGDHEAKVLLASFGVPVTRQAVATTASAAARVGKKAGYPVEIKPWDPDVSSEADGCPVERDLSTAADIRRAFAAVARDAGLPAGAPVIVRAAPGRGRELAVRFARVADLGPMAFVDVNGTPGPRAARAPLRRSDALELAHAVEATRAGDPEPDHDALADLLVRASHLAAGEADVESLELGRVIVFGKGDGAVVADARATLRPIAARS